MAKNTYGTGCFLLLNTGRPPRRSPGTACSRRSPATRRGRPRYALEGSVFIGGAAVQWLRDELGLIATAAETEAVAESVPDTGGVYLVPAFAGLGAPYWDMYARGAHRRASPAAPAAPTSSARRSRASPTRRATSSSAMRGRYRHPLHRAARGRRRLPPTTS